MYQRDEEFTNLDYGDFIKTSHWRLSNIRVSRALEQAERPEDTIDSNLSPIDTHILLVPPHLIGIHEDTIGNPLDPTYIPPGQDHSGFAEINLSVGWGGPTVAVAAQTPEIYEKITNVLKKRGGLGLLSELDYGALVTLDGHHRLEMAIALGWSFIPVQLIPFPHSKVVIGTWRDDGYVWNHNTVLDCGQIPKWKAPAKRTKFQMVGQDGVMRRIRNFQPRVDLPLSSLK